MIWKSEGVRRRNGNCVAGFRRWNSLLFAFMLAFGSGGFAQSPDAAGGLTEVELKGKGMFQQRCAVCHLPLVVDNDSTWGPKLSAQTVNGREAVIREFIRQGTPRMPGFQHGLSTEEIDNIIEYLKTVR
jgi:mono/diheme cytochrome c family protein